MGIELFSPVNLGIFIPPSNFYYSCSKTILHVLIQDLLTSQMAIKPKQKIQHVTRKKKPLKKNAKKHRSDSLIFVSGTQTILLSYCGKIFMRIEILLR